MGVGRVAEQGAQATVKDGGADGDTGWYSVSSCCPERTSSDR